MVRKRPINLELMAATALIVGAGVFLYFHASNLSKKPILSHNITDLSNNQVPPGLPADIVLSKDAQVVHSYTATDSKTGMTESTIIYTSKEKQATIMQEYNDYLAKNGWTVHQQTTPSSTKALAAPASSSVLFVASGLQATKGSLMLSVRALQANPSAQQLVTIDLLERT